LTPFPHPSIPEPSSTGNASPKPATLTALTYKTQTCLAHKTLGAINHGTGKNKIGRTALADTLSEVCWDELNETGAYVERGSGDLYRVPKEALIPGGSPIIHQESAGTFRLVQISRNPFVTTLEARLRCAQHNIEPNF